MIFDGLPPGPHFFSSKNTGSLPKFRTFVELKLTEMEVKSCPDVQNRDTILSFIVSSFFVFLNFRTIQIHINFTKNA